MAYVTNEGYAEGDSSTCLAFPTKAALRRDQCTLDFDRQNLPPTQPKHCGRLRIATPEVVAPA
jgi:hypothetical protein